MPLSVILHFSIMGLALGVTAVAVMTAKRKADSLWMKKHRSRAITAGALAVSGVVVIAVFKTIKGFPHMKSPHAIGGMVTVIVILLALALGTLLLRGNQRLRLVHRFIGWVAVSMMCISALFGVLRLMSLSG